MVLSFDADGSQAVTGTETFLFAAVTTTSTHFCYVHCHNMAAGDVYRIRTYVKDENAATTRVLYNDKVRFKDVDGQPVWYIPPVPTESFRVSVQKISGIDRTFTWQRGTF